MRMTTSINFEALGSGLKYEILSGIHAAWPGIRLGDVVKKFSCSSRDRGGGRGAGLDLAIRATTIGVPGARVDSRQRGVGPAQRIEKSPALWQNRPQ
jgi:hypothetical protein